LKVPSALILFVSIKKTRQDTPLLCAAECDQT
jgi:hypothetical protein